MQTQNLSLLGSGALLINIGILLHHLIEIFAGSKFLLTTNSINSNDLINPIDNIKQRLYALYLASQHPKTPGYVKFLLAGIIAYLASPIDLIPDFVPLIGYLDELLLIPLGIWLAVRLIPKAVWNQSLAQATSTHAKIPVNLACTIGIVLSWLSGIILLIFWMINY